MVLCEGAPVLLPHMAALQSSGPVSCRWKFGSFLVVAGYAVLREPALHDVRPRGHRVWSVAAHGGAPRAVRGVLQQQASGPGLHSLAHGVGSAGLPSRAGSASPALSAASPLPTASFPGPAVASPARGGKLSLVRVKTAGYVCVVCFSSESLSTHVSRPLRARQLGSGRSSHPALQRQPHRSCPGLRVVCGSQCVSRAHCPAPQGPGPPGVPPQHSEGHFAPMLRAGTQGAERGHHSLFWSQRPRQL